ncbi:DNA polymerase III subunit beta [Bacillus sp. FJAT-49736]|uniref:DNA polymerase III subunit beta n=1 Tax=Bacillus sp. FJAT-49736 TaxID=2833582 RepID=UPI001BC9237F|nr:DNA polymerase III subunit beta [Bacillus sp. FJAT-49736]MBS4172732.1 DNA polymerase III subunit beta [Bacillus sp. FJAT-49736]
MEMIVNNEYFSKAISDVCRGVLLKSTYLNLSGIKLVVDHENVKLLGTNQEIFIERVIPLSIDGKKVLEVVEPGTVVLSSKYLSEMIKKMPNDIHIKVKSNRSVSIQSDEIMTTLNGFDPNEFPELPDIKNSTYCKIPTVVLLEMIRQTIFAVSTTDLKPVLTGVCMTFCEGKISFAATNSHRLAYKELLIDSNIRTTVIVPSNTLAEVMKLLSNETDDTQIFISKTIIVFKTSTLAIYSRLIEGTFPNIQGLIPKECKTTITLKTKPFLKGIDRATLFANEWKNNNVHLEIKNSSELSISSSSNEIGKMEETQSCAGIIGDMNCRISLNGSFLIDVLKVMKEEEIRIKFNGSMKPVLIEPVGEDSSQFLISPVRSK